MNLLRYLFTTALFWLVFLAGYLCRDVLGDWLLAAHSVPFWEQTVTISSALFRVFWTFVLVSVVGSTCVFIAFFTSASLQELWYQFFQRRIMSLLSSVRDRREKEIQEAAATGDADGIGAPTESVNARKHAASARAGKHNPPSEKVIRLTELAELALKAEPEDDEIADMRVEVDP